MNWSMMHCAVLAKSPNCASQSTSWSGLFCEYPSSNPSTAYSERWLFEMVNSPWSGPRCCRKVWVSSVTWSWTLIATAAFSALWSHVSPDKANDRFS